MLAASIHVVERLFQLYGAWGIFLASVLEEIFVPIPSTLVMMGGGFSLLSGAPLSMAGVIKLFHIIVVPAAAGVTLGSLVVYFLAYTLGKPFLERYGAFFGLSWRLIERVQSRFGQGYADELVLFLSRAIPAMPSVAITAFCGLTRVPVKRYIALTFLGMTIRATILGWLGWQLGGLYHVWARAIDRVESYVLIGIVIGLLVYILIRITKKPVA